MGKFETKKLAFAGLMAAIVMVGTMLIQIPTPAKGYIHIGDSLVYLSGVLLGPLMGSLAAAVGSTLADLVSGYAIYAPATFLIKGVDAFVTGFCFYAFTKKKQTILARSLGSLIGIILGGSVMVGGYLVYETIIFSFPVALLSMLANITQAVGGGLLALPLILTLKKLNRY